MSRDDQSRRARFEAEALPHLDAMYRTALRLTRSPSDADDLVQDAAIKAYRFFDSYEPGTHLRAWLLKILTNLFYSRHRRSSLEQGVRELALVDPVADGWMSAATVAAHREPERAVERPLLGAMVARALDDIPEDFRTVLVLVDIEGLTYREVADAMGCPMGTVMSRLHRGRRALAQRLGIVPAAETAPAQPSEPVVSLDSYRRRRERVG